MSEFIQIEKNVLVELIDQSYVQGFKDAAKTLNTVARTSGLSEEQKETLVIMLEKMDGATTARGSYKTAIFQSDPNE